MDTEDLWRLVNKQNKLLINCDCENNLWEATAISSMVPRLAAVSYIKHFTLN